MLDKSLMLTALGQEEADLVIQGGELVTILTVVGCLKQQLIEPVQAWQ